MQPCTFTHVYKYINQAGYGLDITVHSTANIILTELRIVTLIQCFHEFEETFYMFFKQKRQDQQSYICSIYIWSYI